MADKLNVDTGGTAVGNKLWKMHQDDEQKAVNNHKEGFCWKCEKKKAVSATVFQSCEHCRRNRGHEFTLLTIADKGWDMCMFCGRYTSSFESVSSVMLLLYITEMIYIRFIMPLFLSLI